MIGAVYGHRTAGDECRSEHYHARRKLLRICRPYSGVCVIVDGSDALLHTAVPGRDLPFLYRRRAVTDLYPDVCLFFSQPGPECRSRRGPAIISVGPTMVGPQYFEPLGFTSQNPRCSLLLTTPVAPKSQIPLR